MATAPRTKRTTTVIGLVGGVGSGKSTIARIFSELGAEIVDADRTAHAVLSRSDTKKQIRDRFGDDGVISDGEVDRRRLAEIVFSDPEALDDLERMMHTKILRRMRSQIADADRRGVDAVVVDAPLLVECDATGMCDVMVWVDCPARIRDERLRESRGWPRTERRRRESAQIPLREKRKLADFTIDNRKSRKHTRKQVERFLTWVSTRAPTCGPASPRAAPKARAPG